MYALGRHSLVLAADSQKIIIISELQNNANSCIEYCKWEICTVLKFGS